MNLHVDKIISYDGDTWRIVSTGVTYCHLASMTRFNKHRNGECPVQTCDFIPTEALI